MIEIALETCSEILKKGYCIMPKEQEVQKYVKLYFLDYNMVYIPILFHMPIIHFIQFWS